MLMKKYGRYLFTTFLAATLSSPMNAWEHTPGSDGVRIGDHVYLVGFDYYEGLFVESVSERILAVLDQSDKGKAVYIQITPYMLMSVSQAGPGSFTKDCESYEVILHKYHDWDMGVLVKTIDSVRYVFFVPSNRMGCPSNRSGNLIVFKMNSTLSNSDDDLNVLSFDPLHETITFKDRFRK